MDMKVLVISIIIVMMFTVSCTNDEGTSELEQIKEQYEDILYKHELITEELESAKHDYDDLMIENNKSIELIDELKEKVTKLEESNDTYLSEIKVLQDKSNQEMLKVQNESYMNSNVLIFWEKFGRMEFDDNACFSCETESLGGINIGDSLGDIIKKLGSDFEVYFSDDGFEPVVSYDGISFSINENSFCITEIFTDMNKFETSIGVKVGDDAEVVFNMYRELYNSNEDGSIHPEYPKWVFDLGDNFVIQFDIDTEELTDESVIININIRNFYHGEV